MTEKFEDLRSRKNSKARIKLLKGHFATPNSHINTYIDMSTVKTRHNNARETARVLAEEYKSSTVVETIVCLKNTEVIGAYMAEVLADDSHMSMSAGNNISVVTPEFDTLGQILFRENNQRMIGGKQVLILSDSVTTGALLGKAVEAVLYYGGRVCGICAVFSAVKRAAGMDVKSVFSTSDLPDYKGYAANDCPICKAGGRPEGIVNTFGLVRLEP